jgi:hypothetical protein
MDQQQKTKDQNFANQLGKSKNIHRNGSKSYGSLSKKSSKPTWSSQIKKSFRTDKINNVASNLKHWEMTRRILWLKKKVNSFDNYTMHPFVGNEHGKNITFTSILALRTLRNIWMIWNELLVLDGRGQNRRSMLECLSINYHRITFHDSSKILTKVQHAIRVFATTRMFFVLRSTFYLWGCCFTDEGNDYLAKIITDIIKLYY